MGIEMLHKFRTEPIEGQPICEHVFVDDMAIKCAGYVLEHNVGEVPMVTVEIPIIPHIDSTVDFKIGNLEEIARLMDVDTYKEFKKLWSEIHN